MNFYAITNKGIVRTQNQDCIYTSDNMKLYIIADGMGGANAGDIASKKAVEVAKKYIMDNYTEESNIAIKELIRNALGFANKEVYELSLSNKEYEGMGTTIIILLIIGNKIYIGHIGDSSLYRIRRNVIRKITKDHTYVQDLVDNKEITKQQAKVHPKRHMLTKVLGCDSFVEPDIIVKKIEENDYILMCTDGLTNMVKDREIYNIIVEKKDCKVITETLVDLANNRGGLDNISIILIEIC